MGNISKRLLANRIPYQFFVTKGCGMSEQQIHAGSYHFALEEAGISDYNIMTYSSILPPISQEIDRPSREELGKLMIFGSELLTISSVIHGNKGEFISCGIVFGNLFDKKTNNKIGSLVCEIQDNCNEGIIKEKLYHTIMELYDNTYYKEKYIIKDFKYITNSLDITKKYGTVLCSLCFVNFVENELGVTC